jgi:hypothetical protein
MFLMEIKNKTPNYLDTLPFLDVHHSTALFIKTSRIQSKLGSYGYLLFAENYFLGT